MSNYLETLKNISKDKNKKIESLVMLVVLLVILLVSFGYIFGGNTEKANANLSANSKTISNETTVGENIYSNISTSNNALETKLSTILSQIVGISDVSVVVTYSKDVKQIPVYNTKESEKSGEKTTEKTVAYNEDSSNKSAVIETVELPIVEGVIVVAKGATTVDVRSKIANAVSSVTNVPVYKVQVFEKK